MSALTVPVNTQMGQSVEEEIKNMSKRIPIKTAKEIASNHNCDQILIFGWSKGDDIQYVVTYGKTTEDSDQIAQGGNYIKKVALGWPMSRCCDQPNRVKKLKEKIKTLETALSFFKGMAKQ